MNRSKGVNRVFLVMILVSIVSPYLLSPYLSGLNLYQSIPVSELIYLIPIIGYIILGGGEILNELRLKLLGPGTVLLVILLAFLLMPVMSWINLLSMLFVENYVSSGMESLQTGALAKNLIYVALVPAAAEEFMFRGIFFHGYRPAGARKAAIFSGLCFGLIHMNLNQFCYAFVLGVIFALLVEATGSILSSLIVHFMINSSSVWILELSRNLYSTEEISGAAEAFSRSEILTALKVYTFLAIICGALAYGVFVLITKVCGSSQHMRLVARGEDREEGTSGKVVTVSLILGIVIALVYMILFEIVL